MHRRDLLRFGTLGLGSALLGAPASARPQAKACIFLFLDGGVSHLDTFDLKPEAPAEIRGPYGSIPTTIPGVHVCEYLPQVARQMHRICQVRSIRHAEEIHDPAVYQALTGYRHQTSLGDLKVDAADHPHFACAFGAVDRQPTALPRVIEVPETMRMGARVLPGQAGGYLGRAQDPFRVGLTPEGVVQRPEIDLPASVGNARLDRRQRLLHILDTRLEALRAGAEAGSLSAFQQQALSLLQRPAVSRAFDLDREPDSVRDRYGRHRHGQSVLLARRLVEAGSRFVTVYWGQEAQDWADGKGKRTANNPWDTHRNHFPLVKDELLPRADQTLSALLEDLHQRGLLEEVLVVWTGEFGRTPRISEFASRDHWPHAYTLLMAGGGVPGGAVYGRTDAWGAEITESPVSPADITATIVKKLGVDPRTPLQDAAGRSLPVSAGTPIAALGA